MYVTYMLLLGPLKFSNWSYIISDKKILHNQSDNVTVKLFGTFRMKTLLMLRSSQVNSVSISTSL